MYYPNQTCQKVSTFLSVLKHIHSESEHTTFLTIKICLSFHRVQPSQQFRHLSRHNVDGKLTFELFQDRPLLICSVFSAIEFIIHVSVLFRILYRYTLQASNNRTRSEDKPTYKRAICFTAAFNSDDIIRPNRYLHNGNREINISHVRRIQK